ncbi:MAG: nickel-responsive transcriptional regulator NikR [Archaeoglobi archaeon]|jgi:CopG family nickel-responsive transcriptional regulator|nr:nickel-responsive transcriptional regulator NikR [Archaeoglobi archaeon]TDA25984.1 MAG: nickel-responsive transcriptional regulator NikR [Archaeoglobi archaeon]TDA26115.1 MAG: nickel-responsive transcriptional regulator NikR [Archaeoglobi archaeon]TDA28762.1 MAG: nickel-responsive transcriptional regulator NikR [Archaeoglobi archaeon]
MEENITRIGVSLPKNLLDEFDRIIKNRGYSSRSEAIRDAIRGYIADYKWLESEKGDVIGVLVVVYDHHVRGVSDAIISLQHQFANIITSNMHVHLSEEQCLEIIVVKGNMEDIKKLVDRISATRGVLNHKMITAQKEIQ